MQALRNNATEGIRVYLYNQVLDTGHYPLGSLDLSKREVRYSNIVDQIKLYYCEPGMLGDLHVTGIDTVKRIMCGTFSFDAVNENNNLDTVKIRDARFDATSYY